MASAPPTLSDLQTSLDELLGKRRLYQQQIVAIDTGTETGGPNGDGYYPLEAPDGVTTVMLPSRRKLAAMSLQGVSTRAALAGLNSGASAYLTDVGKEGRWRLTKDSIAPGVAVDPYQMVYVPFALDATGANGGWVRVLNADDPIDTGWSGIQPWQDISAILNSAIVLATVTKVLNAKRARRVLIRPNTYYADTNTTLTGYDVIIDARGAEIVHRIDGIARTYHASWAAIVSATAAVPKGARSIPVTDASAFRRNDVIKLVSDDHAFGNRAGAVVNGVINDYWQGECAIVKSVDHATNTITLMGPIVSGAFQTNPRVALYADRYFKLRGGNWRAWTLDEGAPIAITIASRTGVGTGLLGTNPSSSAPAAAPYLVTMTSATDFKVTDTTGAQIGTGTVGTAFAAAGLSFTLAAGDTAFAAGDSVTLAGNGYSSMVNAQFQWRAYRKSKVRGWESSCNYAQGLWFAGCYDVDICGVVAGNYANIQGNTNQLGYIIFPSNSEKYVADKLLLGTCRHGHTTNVDRVPPGSDPSSYGSPRYGKVMNGIAQGAGQVHWDTHHGAEDIEFLNLRSVDSMGEDGDGGGGGFSGRGQRITFTSCEAIKAKRAFNAFSENIPEAEYTDTVTFVNCAARESEDAPISVRNATNVTFKGSFDGETTGFFCGEFINKNSIRNLGVIRLKSLSTAGGTTYAVRLQDTDWDNRGGRVEIDTTACAGAPLPSSLASLGMYGTDVYFRGGEIHHFLPDDGSVSVTCSKLASDTTDYAPDLESRYNYDADIHGDGAAPSFFRRSLVGGSYTGQSNYISVNVGAATQAGRNKPQWLQTALPDGTIVSRAADATLFGYVKVDGTDTLGDQLDPGAFVGQQIVIRIANQTGSTGGSVRWVSGTTMSFSGTIVGVSGDILVFEWAGAAWQPVNRSVQRAGTSFVPVMPTTTAAVTNMLNQGSGRETYIIDDLPGDLIIQLPTPYTNETWSFYRAPSSDGPGNLIINNNKGVALATIAADATNGGKALIHYFGGSVGYRRTDIG